MADTPTDIARFTGRGSGQIDNGWQRLPVVNPQKLTQPEHYVTSDDLAAAVNVALTLGMPLLITGEPGSGKSQLAYRLAWELGFPPIRPGDRYGVPLKYAVKSTTEARDLFYTFDTVGRFHAAQTEKDDVKVRAENFIEYQALGLAILNAKGRGAMQGTPLTPMQLMKIAEAPTRAVVLLDEIDKAPRDVPNDILTEIEEMRFTVPELGGLEVRLEEHEQAYRPIVIITSNSERDLPEAFLRRCVFHHVPFPPFEEDSTATQTGDKSARGITVRDIVMSRLGDRYQDSLKPFVDDALKLMRHLRQQRDSLSKPPSIAELLNWLDYLHSAFIDRQSTPPRRLKDLGHDQLVDSVVHTLLKSEDDHRRIESLLSGWDGQ